MRKTIIVLLLVALTVGLVACGGGGKEEKSNPLSVDKVYYKINEDGSAKMYIVYTVSSDDETDITLGESASIDAGGEKQSTFFAYDNNKNVFSKLGFPTLIIYKTLYSGSDNSLKYVATFVVNKKYVEGEKMTLNVPYNGKVDESSPVTKNEYLKVTFSINDVSNFEYKTDAELILEVEKDYK